MKIYFFRYPNANQCHSIIFHFKSATQKQHASHTKHATATNFEVPDSGQQSQLAIQQAQQSQANETEMDKIQQAQATSTSGQFTDPLAALQSETKSALSLVTDLFFSVPNSCLSLFKQLTPF